MPSGSDGPQGTEASETAGGTISSQLAYLVPSFDPSKDDLQLYQQKVQLVFSVWPSTKVNELITHLILNTSGTAFAKLQLHQTELCINDEKGVKRLIELLGGHWGKTGLEKRYADAERALYQCSQQNDESHDSYLARADVLWTKLITQKIRLEDLSGCATRLAKSKQPLSHSATLPEWLDQPLSHSATLPERLDQPLLPERLSG